MWVRTVVSPKSIHVKQRKRCERGDSDECDDEDERTVEYPCKNRSARTENGEP